MAGFRVREHQKWRKPPPAPAPKTAAEPKRPLTPIVQGTLDPAARRADAIDRRVRALGPLGWPAVAYDSIFGSWRHHGGAFFAVRFVLVLAAVALFVGGVSGDAPIIHKTGDYRSVTPASVVDTYVTETSVHVYPLVVNESRSGHVRAIFDATKGDLRVPDLDGEDSAYALQVRLVRKDPSITPVLLLSKPQESHRSLAPISDDTVSMKFPPIPLREAGEWELVVHSSRGVGHVEMHLSATEAPIVTAKGPDGGWMQAGIGLVILLILVGAYTPGAGLLQERRDLGRADEAPQWYGHSAHTPNARAHRSRVVPKGSGVLAWKRPGKEAPDRLAKLPGRGWIIRLD